MITTFWTKTELIVTVCSKFLLTESFIDFLHAHNFKVLFAEILFQVLILLATELKILRWPAVFYRTVTFHSPVNFSLVIHTVYVNAT